MLPPEGLPRWGRARKARELPSTLGGVGSGERRAVSGSFSGAGTGSAVTLCAWVSAPTPLLLCLSFLIWEMGTLISVILPVES